MKNYDGALFELMDDLITQTEFDEMVKKIDWKSLKTVIKGVLDLGCGREDGEECLGDMNVHQTRIGQVLDNTFRGQVGCLSLKRAEDEVVGVLMSLVSTSI